MADVDHSRPRPSRNVKLAVAAFVVLALAGIGIVIGLRAGGDDDEASPERSDESREADGEDLSVADPRGPKWNDGVEAIVYLDLEITDEERLAIERSLEEDPAIERFEYLDQAAAHEEFKVLFEDSPEFIEKTEPQDLPASFKLVPVDPAPSSVRRIKATYEDRPGVIKVVTASGLDEPSSPGDPTGEEVAVIIYFDPDVTDEERLAVQAALDEDPDVASYEYLDRDAALEEFERLFPDSPEFTEGVDPEELPTSFRIVPEDDSFAVRLRIKESYKGLPGVHDVVTGLG